MSYKKFVRRPTPSAKKKSRLDEKMREIRKTRSSVGKAAFFGVSTFLAALPTLDVVGIF
ncbi:hypothetical protein [Bradyrhizobium sp. CCGB20]|uniref:hypothetical protein n=1 Tax=Bradyrhizobium sp. CCGB20 TaxID=2949633 RepID=UPI0020B1FC7E|nr:hypothetical protein [Bradyrhizobium sp. CCGB20]MCP3396222.1 hypothetical protein [Bradyrhizobium sp. CCGB20]